MSKEECVGTLYRFPPATFQLELWLKKKPFDQPPKPFRSKPLTRTVDGYVRMRLYSAVPQDRQLLEWIDNSNCYDSVRRVVRVHIPCWWQLWRYVRLWFARRSGRAIRVLIGGFVVLHPSNQTVTVMLDGRNVDKQRIMPVSE